MEHISIERFLQEYPRARVVVRGILGSGRRAEVVLGGMRLQAVYGECFAGTTYLGQYGRLSNKATQRTLRWLVARDLITRQRRVRPEGSRSANGRNLSGTDGTYLIDWSRLWAWVKQLLEEWRRLTFQKMARMRGHARLTPREYMVWFGSPAEWGVVPTEWGGPA